MPNIARNGKTLNIILCYYKLSDIRIYEGLPNIRQSKKFNIATKSCTIAISETKITHFQIMDRSFNVSPYPQQVIHDQKCGGKISYIDKVDLGGTDTGCYFYLIRKVQITGPCIVPEVQVQIDIGSWRMNKQAVGYQKKRAEPEFTLHLIQYKSTAIITTQFIYSKIKGIVQYFQVFELQGVHKNIEVAIIHARFTFRFGLVYIPEPYILKIKRS